MWAGNQPAAPYFTAYGIQSAAVRGIRVIRLGKAEYAEECVVACRFAGVVGGALVAGWGCERLAESAVNTNLLRFELSSHQSHHALLILRNSALNSPTLPSLLFITASPSRTSPSAASAGPFRELLRPRQAAEFAAAGLPRLAYKHE